MPQMRHFENDTWTSINFTTAASGYPMAVSASYGQGTFYALAIPDDFADLYRLPQSVLNQIRALLGSDLFVSLDAPDHVSLFAYDNRTFIVQNFQSQPVTTRVFVAASDSSPRSAFGPDAYGRTDRRDRGPPRARQLWREQRYSVRCGCSGSFLSSFPGRIAAGAERTRLFNCLSRPVSSAKVASRSREPAPPRFGPCRRRWRRRAGCHRR